MSNPGKNTPFSGKIMVSSVQGRLEKVFIVVLMVLGYFSGAMTQLSSTLGDSKLLWQKLCTVSKDKPSGVKHKLFTTGSLQSP